LKKDFNKHPLTPKIKQKPLIEKNEKVRLKEDQFKTWGFLREIRPGFFGTQSPQALFPIGPPFPNNN